MTNPLADLTTDQINVDKVEGQPCAPKSELTLFKKTGPGYVRDLWMAVSGGNNPVLDGRVRVYYDGAASPSIDVDLGTLFAIHWGGDGSLSTPDTHVDMNQSAMTIDCMLGYPMPYGQSIRIAYYNPGTNQTAFVFSETYWAATAADPMNGQRLRCQGVRVLDQLATRQASDVVTLANITGGPGSIVHLSYIGGVDAASISPGSSNNDSWMERNISVARDGEASPSWVTSGTEDAFDGGWYFGARADFSTSRHSYVGTDKPSYQRNCVAMATDLRSKFGGIRFNQSAVMRVETEQACVTGDRFCHAVLYYQ